MPEAFSRSALSNLPEECQCTIPEPYNQYVSWASIKDRNLADFGSLMHSIKDRFLQLVFGYCPGDLIHTP